MAAAAQQLGEGEETTHEATAGGVGPTGATERGGARAEGFELVQQTPRGMLRIVAGPGCEALRATLSPLTDAPAGASGGAVGARLRDVAAQTFLPAGYPWSVGPGYLPFTLWLCGQNALGSANGVLATSFLLYGAGLGAGAIPTAGALNWVLKDGLGQLGSLLFGRAIAPRFDQQPKAWYLLAQAKLNVAMALEVATVAAASLGPWSFLAFGSLANGLKGLSWMAAGSTRSAFNVSFALRDNIGDVTAKATSQAICSSMAGSAAGMMLVHPLGQDVGGAAAVFSLLAMGHMYCAYRCVRAIPLATINPSRACILVGAFLEPGRAGGGGEAPARDAAPRMPTPQEVAAVDPILPIGSRDSEIEVGGDLWEISGGRVAPLRAAMEALPGEKYLVLPGAGGRCHVALREDAGPEDLLQGYLHARLAYESIARATRWAAGGAGGGGGGGGGVAGGEVVEEEHLRKALEGSLGDARVAVAAFSEALRRAGWDVRKVALEGQRRRATW